jgi:hypothetical protein
MAKNMLDPVKIGAAGGRKRAENLTPEERRKSASQAAKARWEEYRRKNPPGKKSK